MFSKMSLFAVAAALGSTGAQAAQIVLSEAAVIGNSGSYNFAANAQPGAFPAFRILDQQTGAISVENFGQGYWLNGDNGPANAYITIDLGAAYALASVDLFNTSNGGAGDRGTGAFDLAASDSVVLDGANGFTLDGIVAVVASGTLAAEAPGSAREPQSFSASGTYRYLQFRPKSVASATPICCGIVNNYGLNELRMFGDVANAVPEPGTWAMMIAGFGLVGAASRRRARTSLTYA